MIREVEKAMRKTEENLNMNTRSIRAGIAILALGMAASGVFAQDSKEHVQSFHTELGEVVEAQENARYNLFGAVRGFSAARLYAGRAQNGERNFVLHVLRNDSAGAQWARIALTPESKRQFLARIDARVQASARNAGTPAVAVYPIADHFWKERGRLKKIALRDGSAIHAALLRAQTDTLFVQTPGGVQVTLPDAQIDLIEDLSGEIVAGEYYLQDPNSTRLLLAPTGRGLKAGQAYFADYFLFFPTLAVGITDNIAISGGISLVPGASSQLAYFGPKLSFPISSHAAFSTGLLYMAIPEGGEDAALGYGVGTFGSSRGSVTLGVGMPFVANEDTHPVLLLGGEVQVSSGAKVLTENWLFTNENNIFMFSGGVRFFGEKLAVDVALVSSDEFWGNNGFPFVPWVDFSIFFGK